MKGQLKHRKTYRAQNSERKQTKQKLQHRILNRCDEQHGIHQKPGVARNGKVITMI